MSGTSDEPLVELAIEAPGWLEVEGFAEAAETGARLALEETGRSPDEWQIALLACDDRRIAALNSTFRGRAAPTDVLSWPLQVGPPPPSAAPRTPLGDVAIALETARKDAEIRGLDLKDHVIHLILHSVLHLLGHDHLDEADAELMERMEVRALSRVGLANPYAVEARQDDDRPGGARPAHPNR